MYFLELCPVLYKCLAYLVADGRSAIITLNAGPQINGKCSHSFYVIVYSGALHLSLATIRIHNW